MFVASTGLMSPQADAHTLFRTTRRFGSLNGWRAIAILGVIWHHTMAHSLASPMAQQGKHGVTLFFVISGFLIVTLLLREKEQTGTISLRNFWGRRCLRILPVYYGTLLLYIVLVGLLEHSAAGQDFFRHLPFFATFTSNLFVTPSDRTIFVFSWSVAAEEQFYLTWPIIEVLVRRRLHKMVILATMIVVTRTIIFMSGSIWTDDVLPLGIMLGTMLAHLLHEPGSFRLVYAVLGRRGSAFACLGLAVTVLAVAPYFGLVGEMMFPIAFAPLIGACVIREDNDLARLLQSQPLEWIGAVSYGTYMLHMLSVNIARGAGSVLGLHAPMLDFIGGAAIAVGLASASYILFERPLLALKSRLFSTVNKPAFQERPILETVRPVKAQSASRTVQAS
jgi:peptidoglycan/LPS O-acetylase OafA/YrhL